MSVRRPPAKKCSLQQINATNIMPKSTFSGLQRCRWQYGSIFIRLVIASKIDEIPRNSPKIRTYSTSRSSKVIEIVVNRKRIFDFLLVSSHSLVINSNFVRISYRFRDIDAFCSKIACFPTPPLFDSRWRGTPWDINEINTPLESTCTFSVLQLQVYLHSFSRCFLPKSQNHVKFRQNLTLQQFKVIQGQVTLGVSSVHSPSALPWNSWWSHSQWMRAEPS